MAFRSLACANASMEVKPRHHTSISMDDDESDFHDAEEAALPTRTSLNPVTSASNEHADLINNNIDLKADHNNNNIDNPCSPDSAQTKRRCPARARKFL